MQQDKPHLTKISIHALREEGDHLYNDRVLIVYISIHALREEGDYIEYVLLKHLEISIHALREEGDDKGYGFPTSRWKFLSTPSARRATGGSCRDFSHWEISIHALREEGDTASDTQQCNASHFYPRPPRGGRPPGGCRSCRSGQDFYPRPPRGGRLTVQVRHTAF